MLIGTDKKQNLDNKTNIQHGISLDNMSNTPKMRVSFKFYEEKNQMVKLEELEQIDCRRLLRFIARLQKSAEYIDTVNRGPIGKNNKLCNHKFINDIVHLRVDERFRLHGVIKGVVFYIICIDPYHEINKQ